MFVPAAAALKLIPFGFAIPEGYGLLATKTKGLGICLFRVKPKLHLQEHFPKEWELQIAAGAKHVINFLVWACWSDEDYIGRVCRISRQTHPFTTGAKTIFRALMKYKRILAREIPLN